MTAGTLIIRADASIAIGTGHVMRCLALAQAWRDSGGNAVFAMAESTAATDERLRSEEMEIAALPASPNTLRDARHTAALARDRDAAWVIVDGYQFDAEYQINIKKAGLKLLLVDDTGQCEQYFADLVLNQNVGASEEMYQNLGSRTRLLLGSHYALLRREFQAWYGRKREVTSVGHKVLIAMGGSDAENVTLRVIDALRIVGVEGLEAVAAVGGSNPHWESLQQAASQFPGKLQLRRDVCNMPELMAWADVAISAGGGTCYELALLQVPMLLITVAENQEHTCRALAGHGAAIDLGWFHSLDANRLTKFLQDVIVNCDLRHSLIENARSLVDGNGAQRVMDILLRDSSGQDESAVSKLQVSVE